MATFNPFGFLYSYSTSAASQASPTLVEFPWNPLFSGWSGDLAIQYLPGAGSDTAPSSADGFVYPGYISTNVDPSGTFNYPPIVGVIAGFRYVPNNDSILSNDTWPSFVAGTAVIGKVYVVVNTDIQARYQIQYDGRAGVKGVTQNLLFGQATLGADNTFVQTVSGNTFTFAVGTPNSTVGGANGALPGTSTLFITNLNTQRLGVTGNKLARTTSYPVFLLTPAQGNDWYDPTDPNASANENTIMNVLLNNNFTTTNWEPILAQVPTTV
jgi:hypothetical protein